MRGVLVQRLPGGARAIVAGGALALLALAAACSPPAPAAQPGSPAPAPPAAAAPGSALSPAAKPAPSPAAGASPSPAAKPARSPSAGSPSPAAAGPAISHRPPLPVPPVSDQARQDAESFYRGKTVRIIVGYSPGGGFDAIARLVARYMGQYLPGRPTFVVDNQPGASGAVAANQFFNSAPRDGTVLHAFAEPLFQAQIMGQEGLQFDARQMTWLGTAFNQTIACIARTASGITSFKEVMEGKELRLGSLGRGTYTHDFPSVLKGTLKANLGLVPGYSGTNDIRLALERGEVNGLCTTWDTLRTTPQWFEGPNPFARVILQQGAGKSPDLPNVPLAEELTQDPTARQMIRAITATPAIGKPFAAPPGTPPERAAVLRAAFTETMNDPRLREEATRARLEIYMRSAEEMTKMVDEIMSVPPEVVAEIKRLIEAG